MAVQKPGLAAKVSAKILLQKAKRSANLLWMHPVLQLTTSCSSHPRPPFPPQVEEFYVLTWESPKEMIFEMPVRTRAVTLKPPPQTHGQNRVFFVI